MNVITTRSDLQIGGGSGWVAARVSEGLSAARRGLESASFDWGRPPAIGPHPREAALAASREAIVRLNEALSVEAPEDAVEDTRHALQELSLAVHEMEAQAGTQPIHRFERAIELLVEVEHRLTHATVGYG